MFKEHRRDVHVALRSLDRKNATFGEYGTGKSGTHWAEIEMFDCWVVSGAITEGNLPRNFPLVEIECGDTSIRWFDERKTLRSHI